MCFPQRVLAIACLVCPLLAGQTGNPAEPYDPVSLNGGMGAIVPADRDYEPMTGSQRLRLWRTDTFLNPYRLSRIVLFSGLDLAQDRPSEWNGGLAGYGQRFGSRFARSVISSSIEASTAAALGYDTRYIRSRSESKWKRAGHAVAYRFVTVNRNGKRVFNLPQLSATFGSEMVATRWTPREKWSAEGVRSANEQVVFGIGMNLVREFLPELKRAIRRK